MTCSIKALFGSVRKTRKALYKYRPITCITFAYLEGSHVLVNISPVFTLVLALALYLLRVLQVCCLMPGQVGYGELSELFQLSTVRDITVALKLLTQKRNKMTSKTLKRSIEMRGTAELV